MADSQGLTMRKIFISYRRSEAEYAAGALGRELRAHFGEHQVFRDKEDIGAGASWKKAVLGEIDQSSALLVLIGSQWTKTANAAGERRLDREDDPIVLEIADGIADGASVIPVLLENAVMPGEAELPEKLRPMAEFNALRLRDGDWTHDVNRICKALETAGFVPQAARATAAQAVLAAPPVTRSGKMIASYVLSVLALMGYKETHDADTFWGLAIFGLIAFVLGALAYRDFRKGFARSQWPSLGAMVLGGFCTLGYTAWALDPNVPAQSPDSAATNTPTAGAPNAPTPANAVANVPNAVVNPAFDPVAMAPANINGRWTDANDGTTVNLTQTGERVQLSATTQVAAMQGVGTLVGRQLDMTLSVSGMEIGTLRMTLDPNGRRLAGAMNVQGKVQIVAFQR